MRSRRRLAAGLVAVSILVATGCGSSAGPSAETPSAPIPPPPGGSTSAASPTSGTRPAGKAPSGRGDGGKFTPVTKVDLNTDGDSPGGANIVQVVTATKAFLTALDDTKRNKVEYDFADNQARQTWSNFPARAVPRKGVALADLTGYQQAAALAVLAVALSGQGNRQDSEIQKADDYLASLDGPGADSFGALNYWIAVYGTPSTTSPFMIQFGGHHLARNLTYNGDKVSQTPQFVGAEPASIPSAGGTIEPVKAESSSMFALIAALTKSQRKSAEITSGTIDDLLMGPGEDSHNFPPSQGLPVSGLAADQKELVTAAITAYAGDLATDAATKLIAKYSAELDQTTIGWANTTSPTDRGSYLRIDGPSVWIELITVRSPGTAELHVHTVYRDKTNDYGSKPASR